MLSMETGTGQPDSDTYADIGFADAYCAKYGNMIWQDVSTPTKEVALRGATRALDLLYGTRFAGQALTQSQALAWPRQLNPYNAALALVGVPACVREATVELALIGLATDVLAPAVDTGNIKSETKIIGQLEKTTEYFAPTSSSAVSLRKVNLILQPVLTGIGGLYVPVVRG